VEHAFASETLKDDLRQRLWQAFEHPGPVRR